MSPDMTDPFSAWRAAIARLETGATLVSLWGDGDRARMAARSADDSAVEIVDAIFLAGAFPSVGARHRPAARLERALCDLYGVKALGAEDPRAWLDHGRWPIRAPLGAAEPCEPSPPALYAFLGAEGPALHQIPVGPVHAGIIEPGHFRFHASGETVVRLEERLGYVHKGVDRLMQGQDLLSAARLAARVSGDSAVAYQIAFAEAVETALRSPAPPRARWLRALLLECERIANHFGDIGAVCNDASFGLMQAHCSALRERVLRFVDFAFGHRLGMDVIVPGGVAGDLGLTDRERLRSLIKSLRKDFAPLVNLYDNTTSLQDRTVGTGVLSLSLAKAFGCGGVIGRASGRSFDARRAFPRAPYDLLTFEVPTLPQGDVNARVWIRIREVEQSFSLIEEILERLPSGATRAELTAAAESEGFTFVEGFRGDVFAHVRLSADGRVARCHLRDPSWFQWPLLEAAIEGNIVADFPLCNKSFNCSYSGHDL